jgi:PAS domain S-box-containing protein
MKPIITGFAVFVLVATLTQFLAYQRYLISQDTEMQKVVHELNTVKDKLKTSLSYSLSATKTLAFLIENYGIPNDFNSIAKAIIESNKDIDALQLTKKGIITHVYPLEDNASAIGYDVLGDSLRSKEAYSAIEKKELFFAGPFELKQGGIAIVGRLPIFIDNQFWGFSAVLIKLSTLLKAAGVDSSGTSDFTYQLSKINPTTQKEEFFLPDSIPRAKRRSVSIEVPDGAWKLYVSSKRSTNFFDALAFSLLGITLSFLAGLFTWHLSKQPERLTKMVEEKTLQLAASEKYFRALIEKSSDAIVLLDDTGKVLYQSPSTDLISGYSIREIQAIDSLQLIHPDDRENDIAMFKKLVLCPGEIAYRTHRFKHKKGHYIWVEGTYTNLLNDEIVNAIIYNYKDISDRKRTEQEIILEKNLSVSMINSLPGIFYLYDKFGKFIRWNKNFETVSGYSAEEMSSMHPLDFFDGDEKDLLREKINAVFTAGSADVQAHFYTKDKKKIPYYFNGRKANFNGLDYLLGMGIDITDRVKAENELLKRTAEIQNLTAHLERIREEERTRIAREIHDELGQQLTGLKMDVSWIMRKILPEDKPIHEKLSTMISLIDETVKTVRRISSELRPGILDDLGLIPALEWQGQEFEKRTGIKSLFYTQLIDFKPERELSTNIFRVYQEALTNIARHAQATLVETSLEEKNGYVMLAIKDNGIGFAMEEAKTKNSLGLIGMRERALMFQGEITIESKKEKGTTVTLKVPFLEADKPLVL